MRHHAGSLDRRPHGGNAAQLTARVLAVAMCMAAARPAHAASPASHGASPVVAGSDGVARALAASEAGRHDEAMATIDAAIARAPSDSTLQLRRSGIAEAWAGARLRVAQADRTPSSWRDAATTFDDAAASAARWLELAPDDAPNRIRVETRIAALRKRAQQARTIADTLEQPAIPAPAIVVPPPPESVESSPSLASIDATRDQREHNAERRAAGAVVLGLGIAAAGAGIGLVATSLTLHYPTGCSDADPTTTCEDVAVRTRRGRLGAGAATGVTAAVMMGIGAALLVRTPQGNARELSRAHVIGARAGGGFTIAVGMGLLAAAGALGGTSARDYDAAGARDEADMRNAVARANAALGLGVAGVVTAVMGAGLLSVPNARRGAVALRGVPVVGVSFVGATVGGRIPW